ncbi:hypothetical protein KDK95_31500 [Actinospica sp. MGRD01-02]|uniref:Uncharacterized protein n=1 Tax=Actinospica acidithermotolerans TaxID=2828514 RepID=A0A941EI00_9ACTN|nr:hypothetical protein [Actinospica acidithermotolerans]MBR7830872.1 hypothetical protein [Actinospica acidithermotolerans]
MRVPQGVNVPRIRAPRALAAGVGTLLQAADLMTELGTETVRAALSKSADLVYRASCGYQDAADRGELVLSTCAAEASRRLVRTADDLAAWADRHVVRRVIESMTPYLIDQLVPTVIDGVMPKIRTDVIPVVIEDLADDERVRAMIAQQSQDVLTWGVTEVRRASANGDDRVESALHRVLRRDARP